MKRKKDKEEMYDLIIIGGGVSALGAAIYSGRFQMKTAVIGEKMGGTIIQTDEVSNYPGFNNITGMDLIDKLRSHANDYEVEFIEEKVSRITRCAESCFKVYTGKGHYHTKTIIIATGTEWRKLNVPGEAEFKGRGVHYCALCDGPFFQNKVVAVVGGSDSAAKEALLMSRYAKKVYMIVRGFKLRAEPINMKRVLANKRIEIINNNSVNQIKGEAYVSHVELDKLYNSSRSLKVSAVFIDVGHVPLSGLAKKIGVKLNEKGEIITNRDSETNIRGIFAAGDVANSRFKQAITGVGEGVVAAYSAYHYINSNELVCYCNDEDMQ